MNLMNVLLMMGGQGATQAGGDSMLSSIILVVLIFAVVYLFFIRPQLKKNKKEKKIIENFKNENPEINEEEFNRKIFELNNQTSSTVEINGVLRKEDIDFYKANKQRAKTAIILIWIIFTIEIVSIISDFFQYQLLQTGSISNFDAMSNDSRQQAIAAIYLIMFVISSITFIQWFRRAYFNLHIISKNLKFTEGWAAGGWFVPIVNLWYPYTIMREIFTETFSFFKKNNYNFENNYKSSIIGWWWALWIISSFFAYFGTNLILKANNLSDISSGTLIQIFASIISCIGAIIIVRIIKKYSEMEDQIVLIICNQSSKSEYSPVDVNN